MLISNSHKIFHYTKLLIFFYIMFPLINNSINMVNYTEELYLSNQVPLKIDPDYKIKSIFNFPEFNPKNNEIKPVEKKYKTRRIIPKAPLN